MRYFQTRFLPDADRYLEQMDAKSKRKVLLTIELAEHSNDATLFKKLQDEIWEFRILYSGNQIRFLAFWDKTNRQETLVIATHGFSKKTDKIPKQQIDKAKNIRTRYFEQT